MAARTSFLAMLFMLAGGCRPVVRGNAEDETATGTTGSTTRGATGGTTATTGSSGASTGTSGTSSVLTSSGGTGTTGGTTTGGTTTGSPVSHAGFVEIPMQVVRETMGGALRFRVLVSIGGSAPIPVMLDTGSSGLRILAGAIPDSRYAAITSTPVTFSYHGGQEIKGVVAMATVGIGALATRNPIPVMLIQEVGCTPEVPHCNAEGETVDDFTLFGSNKAFLGVGMRLFDGGMGIGNPIAQLVGSPPFVVVTPPRDGGMGVLRIGPEADQGYEFKTYQLPGLDGGLPLPNGAPPWDDRFGLPACIDDLDAGTDYCLPAVLDTGDPGYYVEWPPHENAGPQPLPSGSLIEITVGPVSVPLGQYSFIVPAAPVPRGEDVLIEPARGAPYMNLGNPLFFRFVVRFDQAHGTVGLARP